MKNRSKELTLARQITKLENQTVSRRTKTLLDHSRRKSFLIGVTGAAGAGKSTLCARLIQHLRKGRRKIGFIGCDPSSPYSGGSFLGDRIRMHTLSDPRVFIRSMATRGELGGLAKSTPLACGALAKHGFNPIFVESVGVGQTDVSIAKLADVVLVVLTADLGDPVQLSKAGVLEIADAFVINKSDTPQVQRIEQNFTSMFMQGGKTKRRPLFKTVATRGLGIESLAAWIENRMRAK